MPAGPPADRPSGRSWWPLRCLGELVTGGCEAMPFTFKLAKRLALSKAVRATAARALSALRQVSTNPALAVPASPASSCRCRAHHESRGALCRLTDSSAKENSVMTFKHKLSRRLALLKDAWLVVALAALGCERPLAVTGPSATIRLQITPKSVTMPTDGAAQLMAVALTPAGDTATIDVNLSVTGGTIADTNTHGGRHYAGYKATQNGKFKVVAHGHGSSGSGSDTATITVVPAAVASMKVIPA